MKRLKVEHVYVLLDDFFYNKLHLLNWKFGIKNRKFNIYRIETTKGGAKYKISIQEEITGTVNPKFKDGNSLNCQLDNLE